MSKPTVLSRPLDGALGTALGIGHSALVFPINHPSGLVSNTKPVQTSEIVRLYEDGFETKNTRYVNIEPKRSLMG